MSENDFLNDTSVEAEQTSSTVDGVRAIELFYRPVRRISSGSPVFYQSQMRLNSPSLGTLLPEVYQAAAEASEQCIALFKLGFIQLVKALEVFEKRSAAPDFITYYMPVRYLKALKNPNELSDICHNHDIEPYKLCFELSSDLLFEAPSQVSAVMSALSQDGFRFILSGYGSPGAPLTGLAAFPTEFVILDKQLAMSALSGERESACLKALVTLASSLGSEIVVPPLDTDIAKKLGTLGCTYILSTDFSESRYTFRKKS